MRRVVLLLLLAVPLRAQDAATLALLVREPSVDAARVAGAVKSPDALTRATAARLALVRDLDAVVPQLREALAAEKNAEAAREQVRALVILGVDDDIAFAAEQLPRFPTGIDGVFSEALARLGAPRALDLYLKYTPKLRAPSAPLHLALWGRSAHASALAARLLGKRDERGFTSVVSAFTDAKVALDPGVAMAGLGAPTSEMRASVLWHLIETYAADPAKIPELLREPILAPAPEGATVRETFGRELLRRMLGGEPRRQKDWIECVNTSFACWGNPDVVRFLTPDELATVGSGSDRSEGVIRRRSKQTGTVVAEPAFALSLMLPPGLPEALMKQTRCREGWMGIAGATVDRVGRVQSIDLKQIGADGACRKALETMMRLSLAEPSSFVARLTADDLLMVKARGDVQCMDEGLVENARVFGVHRFGGGSEIKAPKVVKREEPMFPESARRSMTGGSMLIIMESHISKTGCVRDIRLLKQSPWPELNGAAVFALSKWKFEPGKLDGVPVDVIFNLTVNFKLR